MLKVTIKGSSAADLLVNILALAASMGGSAAEPSKTREKKTDTKVGTTPEPEKSKEITTPGSTGGSPSSSAAPAITLADLQALGSKIQGLKTKDADKGAKAVAAFKDVVTKAGGTRLSDPNLSAEKFPEIKKALEAICTEYGI